MIQRFGALPGPPVIVHYRTIDAPAANGRTPRFGEESFRLAFPLEDGRQLVLEFGAVARRALRQAVLNDELRSAMQEAGEGLE